MPNNYQIQYEIKALDKATAVFDKIDRRLKEINKNLDIQNNKYKNAAKTQTIINKNLDKERQARYKLGKELHRQTFLEDTLNKEKMKGRREWMQDINREERVARRREQIRKRELKFERDITKARRARRMDVSERGYTYARNAALAVTTPTAIAAGFSLRNRMTVEQFEIALNTLYGDQSEQVRNELLKFGYETQFNFQQASRMLLDLKKGARNLPQVNTVEQQLEAMRMIGKVILSYATKPEDRQEISYQLGQGFMRGIFDERQDIRVMLARGLHIYDAVEEVTGMTYEQVKEKYGSIPAPIIFEAMRLMADSPEVMRSMKMRQESLTLSFEQFKDSLFLVTSEYGELIDKNLGLSKLLSGIGDEMFAHFNNLDKGNKYLISSSIQFGATWAVTVPVLVAASFAVQKMRLYIAQSALLSKSLGNRFMIMTGLMSGLYLATSDWSQVLEDIKNEGFAGIFNHLDKIVATMFVLQGLGASKLLKDFKLLKVTALSIAGILKPVLGIYAAYKGGKFIGEKIAEKTDQFFASREEERNIEKWESMYGKEATRKVLTQEKVAEVERKEKQKAQLEIQLKQDILGKWNVEEVSDKTEGGSWLELPLTMGVGK